MKRFNFPAFIGFLVLMGIGVVVGIGFGASPLVAVAFAVGGISLNGIVLLGCRFRKSGTDQIDMNC